MINGAEEADLTMHRDHLDAELYASSGSDAEDEQALMNFLKGR